jgi:hypothetical protein
MAWYIKHGISMRKKTQYISWLITLWKHNEGIVVALINFAINVANFAILSFILTDLHWSIS